MKKLVLTAVVACLSATNVLAAGGTSAARTAPEAAKAAKEAVRPTAPRAGFKAPTSGVSGQTVTEGANIVDLSTGRTLTPAELTSSRSKQAELAAKAEQRKMLEASTSCSANGDFTKLNSGLQASVGLAVKQNIVNQANSCLPQFDEETMERAATIIKPVSDAIAGAGFETAQQAGVEVIAKGLANSARDFAVLTGGLPADALKTIIKVCRVTNEDGTPKHCLFNAAVCNQTVFGKAASYLSVVK